MKVALVCPYAWDRVGGVQSHVRALAPVLRDHGHEVLVIAPRLDRRTAPEEGVAFVGKAVPVPANGSLAPLSFGPLAALGVRRTLTAFMPDVVHVHEPLIPSLSLLALWNGGYPTVGTFHAAAEVSLGYRVGGPVLRRALDRLTIRTAVSDAARALVGRYFPGEYALTPNGVDVRRFADADPHDFGPGPTVLFLSRLERRKGLDVLVQACARLKHLGIRLVVAGSGPEEKECRRLARSLGVAAEFVGRVPEDRLPGLYRGATLYCAPALAGESFGIVLIEAMAAGCPVVCSDLEGFRAVAGGAAALVPPGDPGVLADALRAVLGDAAKRADMVRSGARIAGMYDWGRLVSGVVSIYEKAVERARSRA